MDKKSNLVSEFLDAQNHPFRNEIEQLRSIILAANSGLSENIKWNSPNYHLANNDRITMRVQPPKQIQLIFHCGAKVKAQPKEKIIKEDFGLLAWKGNDRAVASFSNMLDIEKNKTKLTTIIIEWLNATG